MKLGQRFTSFNDIKNFIDAYQKENFVQLYCYNSKKLGSVGFKNSKKANPDLVYYTIQYQCVHGGNFVSASLGKRKSSTLRQGCEFKVRFSLSCDGSYLFIKDICLQHNHEISENVYMGLPKQRRLDAYEEAQVRSLLDLTSNKRLVKDYIKKSMGKDVLIKDLNNVKAKNQRVPSRKKPAGNLNDNEAQTAHILASEFQVNQTASTSKCVMDRNTKYRKISPLCNELATLIADYSSDDFEEMFKQVKLIRDAAKKKSIVSVIQLIEYTGRSSGEESPDEKDESLLSEDEDIQINIPLDSIDVNKFYLKRIGRPKRSQQSVD